MKRVALIVLLMVACFSLVNAQVGRRHKALYNVDSQEFKSSGWHFAPGLTYTLPFKSSQLAAIEIAEDTSQIAFSDPYGKVSVYFGIGRHHLVDLSFLDMIDYGVAYKRLSMGEKVDNELRESESSQELVQWNEDWRYKRNHISGYINFSKWFQFSDYQFITSGFGLNFDYNITDNRGDHDGLLAYGTNYPNAFWTQLHYKFGYGFKAAPRLFILPEVEIPLMTVVPTEYGLFSFPALRSKYVPIIFSVKFAFLSKWPLKDCVGKPKKKTGHELWEPKMRRK